ncbi:dual specificity mitogen-activated protein kinase kinase 5-like isoform X2 [Gigantopelta aegis]|nr:dual specificity mitogen-activated protein kinase kinase 5-like isoform X2 [Gigantopelta aegis]
MSDEDRYRGLFPPLIIYPKHGKTAQKRNIHDLTCIVKPRKPPDPHELCGKEAAVLKKPTNKEENVQPIVSLSTSHRNSFDIRDVLACGTITDDLQVLEFIGSGNGGRVSRAIHKPSGRLLAVKVIQLDISPEVQKQIISELEVLYKCQSRSIIAFYGAFFLENRISICTEFMDGGSLDKYMPIPELVLGRMAVYIIDGLLYMWNLSFLHRDIKPSNVLVSSKGDVKLCDFGVSTQLVKSIAITFIGTNVYMAPERIQGEKYYIPAEVWSFGVTLFELATGKLPFQSISSQMMPFDLMKCIVHEKPMNLPQDIFSPQFVNLVGQSLVKDPSQRLTAAELMNHPFIQRHTDGNITVIAEFIHSRLQKP